MFVCFLSLQFVATPGKDLASWLIIASRDHVIFSHPSSASFLTPKRPASVEMMEFEKAYTKKILKI